MASVNMNFIFILSVILKGIGAVLEIALQILLTKLIGLSGYGSYSTWISGARSVILGLFLRTYKM